MSRPPPPPKLRLPYWVTMALSTLTMGGLTVLFVLVVLPQRFVLQGDLRASGVTFPAGIVPFGPGAATMRPPRVIPTLPGPSAAAADAPTPVSFGLVQRPRGDEPVESAPEIALLPASPDTEIRSDTTVAAIHPGSSIPDSGAADPVSPVDAARRAVAEGAWDEARTLYEAAIRGRPDDAALHLEWADALQFQLADLEGARSVLLRRRELTAPDLAERFRIAQLHIWIGEEEAAESELRAVLAGDDSHAGAWALQGELHRWAGSRSEAADAYRRALEIDPEETVALAGRALLTADTERAVAAIDGRRLHPAVSLVQDSDGFRRTEARAYASMLPFPTVVDVLVGYRRVEGLNLAGLDAADDGGFFEMTGARWMREGEVRASATLGVERSALGGTEPILGAALQVRDLRGWNLAAAYRRAPGHTLASTFESLAAGLTAERLALDLYRGLPARLELSATLEGVRLHGSEGAVGRVGAGVAVTRVVGGWFRTGISSRFLTYAAPSPIIDGRRLFWDPESYWSTGALLEIRTPDDRHGTSAFLRATPGLALAWERGANGPRWAEQFESEAGLRVDMESFVLSFGGFYARGRDGGYTSRGVTLGVEVLR